MGVLLSSEFKLRVSGLHGKVIVRGDEAYEQSVYQYGWSSLKDQGLLKPLAIIYAIDDHDVIKTIQFAKMKGMAVAIRTGGHHYTAASSTNERNLQLDLSKTYTDFQWKSGTDHSLVTVGISLSLGKFQELLKEQHRFVPAGQCSYVNLGGHVQTGGYGQLLRSFGLLADYVEEIRIIPANCKPRWLQRGVKDDEDLFYAILGGSPGNFGVLTHVTLNVLKDEDHPKSCGLRTEIPYSAGVLKRLLDLMVDLDDTEDTEADYNYCVSFASERNEQHMPMPLIVVFALWSNLEGKDQGYSSTFFDKIREIAIPNLSGTIENIHPDGSFDGELPMSEMCSYWLFPTAREFELPYYKRGYVSNSRALDLKATRWTEWNRERIEEIQKPLPGIAKKVFIAAQYQYLGGTKSRFRCSPVKDVSSLSWRDSTFGCLLDAFYDGDGEPKSKAKEWVDINSAEMVGHNKAKFSIQDRRLLWASHDLNLPEARKYYYDQEPGKYDRLSKLKEKYDPSHVFTPNAFSVGPLPEWLVAKMPGENHTLDAPVKQADEQALTMGYEVEP
ncbi:hypothetical protein BG003_001032 [Podila horticola]|nr:hypothetical protein BG003_001032 [Podila horticola]